MQKKRFAVVDTMFARGNMAEIVEKVLLESGYPVEIVRSTVPGFKDLGVECKKLLEEKNCDIAIALGMAGSKKIDFQCAHEASIGIQFAKLLTNKHIIEVFVFESEAKGSKKRLAEIMRDRTRKHALNALWLVFAPGELLKRAGTGQRQGHKNAEPIKL